MELGIENSWYSKQQMHRPLNVYPQKSEKVPAGKRVGDRLRETGTSHTTKGTECQNSPSGLYPKVKSKQKKILQRKMIIDILEGYIRKYIR